MQGFARLVSSAFAHRRKTLLNAFSGMLSSSSREDILKVPELLAKLDEIEEEEEPEIPQAQQLSLF